MKNIVLSSVKFYTYINTITICMITIKLSRRHGVHKFYVIHKTVTYTFTTSLQHYIIPYMAKLSSGKV